MATGWFADTDLRGDGPADMWQPCLDLGSGSVPSFAIWFDSKEACEAFIRDEIIPNAGQMAD